MKLISLFARGILLLLILSTIFYSPQLKAQNASAVTGKVTDEKGNALAGVTVTVKGTNTSVVTGTDGTYKINAPSGKNVLIFSYVGFAAREMAIGKNGKIGRAHV